MRKSWKKPAIQNMSSNSIQTGQICTTMQPEGQPSLGIAAPGMCFGVASPNGILYICGGYYSYSASANCAFSASYAERFLCGGCS